MEQTCRASGTGGLAQGCQLYVGWRMEDLGRGRHGKDCGREGATGCGGPAQAEQRVSTMYIYRIQCTAYSICQRGSHRRREKQHTSTCQVHTGHSGVLLRRHGHLLRAPAHHSGSRGVVHGLLGSGAIRLRVVHDVLGQLLARLALLALLLWELLVRVVEGRGIILWPRAVAIRRPVHGKLELGEQPIRHDSGDPGAGHDVDHTKRGGPRSSLRRVWLPWGVP